MKSGVGLSTLLQVALIVLKLCNVIQWGWVWVLAPTWISFLIAVIAMFIIGIFG